MPLIIIIIIININNNKQNKDRNILINTVQYVEAKSGVWDKVPEGSTLISGGRLSEFP